MHIENRKLAVLRRGIESALIASVPQVILPKIEEKLFLRGRESADLGPLFVDALAKKVGKRLPEDMKWLGASAFHFGYAVFWGGLYGLVQEKTKVNPWVGGFGMAAFIHLITFPRWGGAVVVGAVDEPRERPWRMEAVLATAPLVFGLGTALLYGRGPKPGAPAW